MSATQEATDDENQALPEVSFRLGQSIPEVKELLDVFQCSICYEPLKNPVMTSNCSHDFCSLCVRKYLLYKSQCPRCFQDLREIDLRPNRSLSTAMEVASRLIPRLESLVKELRPGFTLTPKPKVDKKAAAVSNLSKEVLDATNPVMDAEVAIDVVSGPRVPCPVCHVQILEKKVNLHLDRCLVEQNGERKSDFVQACKKLKPMSQPVFHLLKETDLRKRLKEHGLDPKGDRKALVARLKNFIVVWNSQCDVDKPMTKLEMVMKVKKEESSLKNLVTSSQNSSILSYDIKTDPVIIEAKQKEYVERNKSHFALLIERAKEAKQAAPSEPQEFVASTSQSSLLSSSPVAIRMGKENDEPRPSCSGITSKKPDAKSDLTKEIAGLVFSPKKRKLRKAYCHNDTMEDHEVISPSPLKKAKNNLLESKKAECPVCNSPIPESLIQKHVDRCLESPPITRSSKSSNVAETDVNDDEMDPDLLNTTPEIIIDDNEVICSTPKEGKLQRRRR